MFDIVALGELLIDFTPQGLSEKGNLLFEANPGGAPANVLAAAAMLGAKTAMIGKVGADIFGETIKNTLNGLHINTNNVHTTTAHFTTLAFVTLDKSGNRSFSFARKNSADVMLTEDDINESLIQNTKIFHCGTLSLTHSESKKATVKALQAAKKNDIIISTDPNLRLALWGNKAEAKAAIELVLTYADIIKISEEELDFLYGNGDIKKNADILFKTYNPKIIFITCGKNGAYLLNKEVFLYHPAFDNIKSIDTTGAGDCFLGAALQMLSELQLDFFKLKKEKCLEILKFANAAAGLSTKKYGALSAMPDIQQIHQLMYDNPS